MNEKNIKISSDARSALAELEKRAATKRAEHAVSEKNLLKILAEFKPTRLFPAHEECRDSMRSMTTWHDDKGVLRRRQVVGIDGTPTPAGAVVMTNLKSRKERLDGIRELIATVDAMIEYVKTKQLNRLPENPEAWLNARFAELPDRDEMVLVGKPQKK